MNSGKMVLIINFLALILIIILGIFEIKSIEKDTISFMENLNDVKKSIEAANWDAAYKNIETLNKNWEMKKQLWSFFVNHNEIDNISMYLKQSIEYIKHKDRIEAMASLAILEHYLAHISEMEKLRIENII
ncbi:MAG: DUF4363 family protein [Caloramator sp.]|nr:DUF4363 family protein [Caloramator sp.]